MARTRIVCSRGPEQRNSGIISRGSIISRWVIVIGLKLVIALLSDVTTHGFLVTLTSMTSNDSSSVKLRCAFGIDLHNVTEVTLGRNETETGSWEILFVYSVDNTTSQFMNTLAGRASADIGGSHTDITIGNATPEDCGLYGCQVTNRLNEKEWNFTRIGCGALNIVNITSSTTSPLVPVSSNHLPVWATVLIVLAVVAFVVVAVSGIIVAAFKYKSKVTRVSPDYDCDLSTERNRHLTAGVDDRLATNGAAENRGKSTGRRRGDGQDSLRYSSSQTSTEENIDRFMFQQQKKSDRTRKNSPRPSSRRTPYTAEDIGSKPTFKNLDRRQSRIKRFDDEEIAEEDEEEKPSTSQNSDQISDMETSTRKSHRGNALPPLRPKKKKKQRKVEEPMVDEPMAVMYKDESEGGRGYTACKSDHTENGLC